MTVRSGLIASVAVALTGCSAPPGLPVDQRDVDESEARRLREERTAAAGERGQLVGALYTGCAPVSFVVSDEADLLLLADAEVLRAIAESRLCAARILAPLPATGARYEVVVDVISAPTSLASVYGYTLTFHRYMRPPDSERLVWARVWPPSRGPRLGTETIGLTGRDLEAKRRSIEKEVSDGIDTFVADYLRANVGACE